MARLWRMFWGFISPFQKEIERLEKRIDRMEEQLNSASIAVSAFEDVAGGGE